MSTEEAFYLSLSTVIADPTVPTIFLSPGFVLSVRTREAAHALRDAATQIAEWFDSREPKPEATS